MSVCRLHPSLRFLDLWSYNFLFYMVRVMHYALMHCPNTFLAISSIITSHKNL